MRKISALLLDILFISYYKETKTSDAFWPSVCQAVSLLVGNED
jgi:hypothetical protein